MRSEMLSEWESWPCRGAGDGTRVAARENVEARRRVKTPAAGETTAARSFAVDNPRSTTFNRDGANDADWQVEFATKREQRRRGK